MGYDPLHLTHNLGLDAENALLAVRSHLDRVDAEFDSIEISGSLPRLAVLERTNAETDRTEKVLIIPERALSPGPAVADPPLTATEPYLPISLDDFILSMRPLSKEEKNRIKMVCGIRPFPVPRTWVEMVKAQELSSERLSSAFQRAMEKWSPLDPPTLKRLADQISAVAFFLFEKDMFYTPEELQKALTAQNIIKEMGRDDFAACLRVLEHLQFRMFKDAFLPQDQDLPLWKYAVYDAPFPIHIDLENGKSSSLSSMALTSWRDYYAHEKILKALREPAKVWRLEELRDHLRGSPGISISTQKLGMAIERHRQFEIVDGYIGKRGKRNYLNQRRILDLIRRSGPLHYTKIAELTSIPPRYVGKITRDIPEIVYIGMGIFDLLENHPELADIPFPRVKRRSFAFAAVYGVLRELGGSHTVSEIHKELKRRGFLWKEVSILSIINHRAYRGFFSGSPDKGLSLK
jgi:hypothetical protein